MNVRKSHWERVYTDKSPLQVSWYQKEPALSLRLIGNAGAGKQSAIIDVGGGASVPVDRLLAAGYARLGVLDISGNALAHAQARLGEKAKTVEWFEADVTAFAAPHRFVQYDAAKMAAELGPEFRLVEEASELHRTPGGKEQKFGYFRFVRGGG
jgi:predicted TPR repeat methyltransferase